MPTSYLPAGAPALSGQAAGSRNAATAPSRFDRATAASPERPPPTMPREDTVHVGVRVMADEATASEGAELIARKRADSVSAETGGLSRN